MKNVNDNTALLTLFHFDVNRWVKKYTISHFYMGNFPILAGEIFDGPYIGGNGREVISRSYGKKDSFVELFLNEAVSNGEQR